LLSLGAVLARYRDLIMISFSKRRRREEAVSHRLSSSSRDVGLLPANRKSGRETSTSIGVPPSECSVARLCIEVTMKTRVLAVLLLASAFAIAEQIPLETAKVISQDLRHNIVVVETARYRLSWAEVGKEQVIFPVNRTIRFYQDGNWFIVLDSNHKKHTFALVHFENIVQEK
jgi:hypothetical protein